jgi:hypothetical protein
MDIKMKKKNANKTRWNLYKIERILKKLRTHKSNLNNSHFYDLIKLKDLNTNCELGEVKKLF